MTAKDEIKSIQPLPSGSYACSTLLVPVLFFLLSGFCQLSASLVVNILGDNHYYSLALAPGGRAAIIVISIILAIIVVVLVFPPSRVTSWFAASRANSDLPKYGLTTYSCSLSLSLLIGFTVSSLVVNLAVITLLQGHSIQWSWFLAARDYWPTNITAGLLASLAAFGLIVPPPSANWLVRWFWQDLWESRR